MGDRLATRKITLKLRKAQTCKVFQCKIDRSQLSDKSLKHLATMFLEAKWFYNHCLAHDDVNDSNTTLRTIPVKVGDSYEDRDLTVLRSHMKQGIKTRLFGSLMSLSSLKKKGFKVGRLKFKKEVNSIPLKEHGNTYYVDAARSRVRLQGMKSWLRVNGLSQLSPNSTIACGTLVRRDQDYYIHITTYQDKEEKVVPNDSIGIDFGCETQMTFSNGIKVQFQIPPSKRLKRLDRKIMKGRRKPSKNRIKDQVKRRKEYEKLTNKKKDIQHKVVSAITSNFRYVCFQDESIHAWAMSGHGKKIQHSGIGSILNHLKHKSFSPLEVNKFFPSTQLCPQCGTKKKLPLWERTYECQCGFKMDRDVKSAICIEFEGLKQIPTERREFTPGEISPSVFLESLVRISGVQASKVGS